MQIYFYQHQKNAFRTKIITIQMLRSRIFFTTSLCYSFKAKRWMILSGAFSFFFSISFLNGKWKENCFVIATHIVHRVDSSAEDNVTVVFSSFLYNNFHKLREGKKIDFFLSALLKESFGWKLKSELNFKTYFLALSC